MAFGALLFIVLFIFWIWALFDCATTDKTAVRNLPKVAWIILIVLFGVLASGAWLLFGRPQSAGAPRAPRMPRERPQTQGWVTRRPAQVDSTPSFVSRPEITDRRSAELDRKLDEWEREQRMLKEGSESEHDET